jgi:hypothetical protein
VRIAIAYKQTLDILVSLSEVCLVGMPELEQNNILPVHTANYTSMVRRYVGCSISVSINIADFIRIRCYLQLSFL